MPSAFSSRATNEKRERQRKENRLFFHQPDAKMSDLRHFHSMKHFFLLKRFEDISMLRSVCLDPYSIDQKEPFDQFVHGWNEQIQQNPIYTPMSNE